MSDQNVFVKLVKKSVGLPTGEESNCCGVGAFQEVEAQNSEDLTACGCITPSSQEAVDLQKDEAGSCGCEDAQKSEACNCELEDSQKISNQCNEEPPANISSCCGS